MQSRTWIKINFKNIDFTGRAYNLYLLRWSHQTNGGVTMLLSRREYKVLKYVEKESIGQLSVLRTDVTNHFRPQKNILKTEAAIDHLVELKWLSNGRPPRDKITERLSITPEGRSVLERYQTDWIYRLLMLFANLL